jgi:aspartate carbamoyltransferase catalytic subunit
MRTLGPGLAARAAALMDSIERKVPIINAGSGKDQHPTQALLDIYTLQRSLEDRGGISGKTIAMMGDLKRGRTVRSLSYLMKNYSGVRLIFISPHAFKMEDDIKEHLRAHNIAFTETTDLDAVLAEIDAIYVTRVQAEFDTEKESEGVDMSRFRIGPRELSRMRDDAVIMHPLPRGNELDVRVDTDPRAKYWRQERNGMWIRAALLLKIFGVASEVANGR